MKSNTVVKTVNLHKAYHHTVNVRLLLNWYVARRHRDTDINPIVSVCNVILAVTTSVMLMLRFYKVKSGPGGHMHMHSI